MTNSTTAITKRLEDIKRRLVIHDELADADSVEDVRYLLEQVKAKDKLISDWESDYRHLRDAIRLMEGHLPEMKTLTESDPDCGINRASDEEIHALNVINEHLEFDFLKPTISPQEAK